MRRLFLFLVLTISMLVAVSTVNAQCSICTKTAGQLGEKRARSLNSGIIYLMLTPFAVAGYVGFRWWKSEKQSNNDNSQHA